MKIQSIRAIPVRLPRDLTGAQGTAGSPTRLVGEGNYRWSSAYPVLYSVHFETALIRVELTNGLVGWGEAQAPLAPEVACTIVEHLLCPALLEEEFDGTPARISQLWERMYATMRVRGQSGGFMIDAMSGVDLALWDLAGKLAGKPVCALLAENPKQSIPAYLSGTSGAGPKERAEFATRYADAGFDLVKLYFETEWSDLLSLADRLPDRMRFAVDALWHLPVEKSIPMALELDERNARGLECPLYPEETEVIPHLSIAMGPQIAAALHFAAATDNCRLCEFNPNVLATANQFLSDPLVCQGGRYQIPGGPGLGIVWNESFQNLCN